MQFSFYNLLTPLSSNTTSVSQATSLPAFDIFWKYCQYAPQILFFFFLHLALHTFILSGFVQFFVLSIWTRYMYLFFNKAFCLVRFSYLWQLTTEESCSTSLSHSESVLNILARLLSLQVLNNPQRHWGIWPLFAFFLNFLFIQLLILDFSVLKKEAWCWTFCATLHTHWSWIWYSFGIIFSFINSQTYLYIMCQVLYTSED